MSRMTHAPDSFSINEIAVVLSHYDIGIIVNADAFARGSAKAPKLLITAEKGAFLLKRRAPGKDAPNVVAFSHDLQLHLADKAFPLPHLIGTRNDNNSMVLFEDAIYELFEYVPGTPFDYSKESVYQSGRTLALFHKLTRDYKSKFTVPEHARYHAHPGMAAAFDRLDTLLEEVATPAERPEAKSQLAKLRHAYQDAAAKVETLGLSKWPVGLVHADFHPGNCLYKQEHVVAVIDFDSCRMQQPILDTANAALQFSIRLGAGDPRTWKVNLHATRLHAFVTGYESLQMLTEAELQSIPWLMIESMTSEVILGLKSKGTMAGYTAPAWLAMLHAKVSWVLENAALLVKALDTQH
jgi:Ser/Thr protein kinase RdoA (MazF antagonist)